MATAQFFIFTVRIDETTGNDAVTCINPEGRGFNLCSLYGELRSIHSDKADSAALDEGVMIQRLRSIVPGVTEDPHVALSYSELGRILDAHGGSDEDLWAAIDEIGNQDEHQVEV